MKLAKQIIMLSAVALLAMGLSFVLVSGIVIGVQASVGPDSKALSVQYKENRTQLIEWHNNTIKTAEDRAVVDGTWTQAQKDEAIATAKKNKTDTLRRLKNVNEQNKTIIQKGGYLITVTITTPANGNFTTGVATTQTVGYTKKLSDAFMYVNETGTTHSNGTGQTTSISNDMRLTPMGAMMVSGIAFTLVGTALVVTVVILNKREANGDGKKATAAKKAA